MLVTAYGNRAFDDTLLELKDTMKICGFICNCALAAVTRHSVLPKYGEGRQDYDDAEELLRSAGLILLDHESRREGITLAANLLFGKDTTIISGLPQHKTDMIFRVQNLDRYDDRDVIVTNLLDSYDRMSEFAKKHLSDPFVLDGMQSVSARDAILREIISNSLAHRDYSSGYVAKMVIEKDRIFAENSNRTHGYGKLNLNTFELFPENPAISKVFREIGLADELGSGMRNTYKFTKLYSGGVPQFVKGDVFKTVIPLSETATKKSGPKSSNQVSDQVGNDSIEKRYLNFAKQQEPKRKYRNILVIRIEIWRFSSAHFRGK